MGLGQNRHVGEGSTSQSNLILVTMMEHVGASGARFIKKTVLACYNQQNREVCYDSYSPSSSAQERETAVKIVLEDVFRRTSLESRLIFQVYTCIYNYDIYNYYISHYT